MCQLILMTTQCELPVQNASSEEIAQILKTAKSIAVVGLSSSPDKPSYRVAEYLISQGYEVIPVNPTLVEWNGRTAYKSVQEIPGPIDIVDIFRRPEDVPPIVDEAIAKNAKVVWMQLGIVNNAAAEKARAAGLQVVMDRCSKIEHQKL